MRLGMAKDFMTSSTIPIQNGFVDRYNFRREERIHLQYVPFNSIYSSVQSLDS
jgi:hypothetical protein